MTRVYVSADMEGVAGISHQRQTMRGTDDFAAARALMTAEVNAAVEGALQAGAVEVLVNDAHGDMTNIVASELHPAASLLSGWPKVPWAMMQGLRDDDVTALFIGYHGASDAASAVVAHAFSSRTFMSLRVNGQEWGEADLNAALASERGVPLGLATGDSAFCRALATRLPGVQTVAVKEGIGYGVSAGEHPARARARIKEAAARVVSRALAGELPLTPRPERYALEAMLANAGAADLCLLHPGTVRVDGRTVLREDTSADATLRTVLAWQFLSSPLAPGHPMIPGGRA